MLVQMHNQLYIYSYDFNKFNGFVLKFVGYRFYSIDVSL